MDAFVGNYEMESRDNLDAFLKGIGKLAYFILKNDYNENY